MLDFPYSMRPHVGLLNPATPGNENSESVSPLTVQQALGQFNVKGSIRGSHRGPVVTLYELEPAPGTRASRVTGLAEDLARTLSVSSVRFVQIPGRNTIGLEIPNKTVDTVFLSELLNNEQFQDTELALPIALGKNILGEPVYADLATMPHLLIAGTTGSGKSVGINAMILSLLFHHTSDTCQMIMIDTKMLELGVYDGIPHLLTPVITQPDKAIRALHWAVREMQRRNELMASVGTRNITGYNNALIDMYADGKTPTRNVHIGFDEQGRKLYRDEEVILMPMPYIVIIIDEVADLMMVAGKELQDVIQRLAQMARAAGIHLMMATQRATVDVITGTIKANFPARISFKVISKIDSRTILGESGAERLLGRGDMLFMTNGAEIQRVHGPFVTDEEVRDVVSFLKREEPIYDDDVVLTEDEIATMSTSGRG